jgi:hypothetical protein
MVPRQRTHVEYRVSVDDEENRFRREQELDKNH